MISELTATSPPFLSHNMRSSNAALATRLQYIQYHIMSA